MKKVTEKFLTAAWKALKGFIIGILTFLFLVVDRQILVLCPWWSSYSALELASKPDRYTSNAFLRVFAVVFIAVVYFLIKWIF